jgi:hypothetical protein
VKNRQPLVQIMRPHEGMERFGLFSRRGNGRK